MSYEIQGIARDTREKALSALIGAYVYNNGCDRDDAIEALDSPEDTARELLDAWGGNLGPGEKEAEAGEIANHIRNHRRDIFRAAGYPIYRYRESSGYTEDLESTDLDSAIEETRDRLRDGDWPVENKTLYVEAWIDDPDDDSHHLEVAIHPEEPECTESEHDWQSPHELLGGLEENPGVWGHGGGVIMTEVCAHCGMYRVKDTWDQSQGPEPVETIEYREADEDSIQWTRKNKAPSMLRLLIEDKGYDQVLSALREFEDDPDAVIDDELDIKVDGEWIEGEHLADLVDRLDSDLRWPY